MRCGCLSMPSCTLFHARISQTMCTHVCLATLPTLFPPSTLSTRNASILCFPPLLKASAPFSLLLILMRNQWNSHHASLVSRIRLHQQAQLGTVLPISTAHQSSQHNTCRSLLVSHRASTGPRCCCRGRRRREKGKRGGRREGVPGGRGR